jgi:Transposase DDE domain
VRRGRRPRQILSAHDPEMRHGHKTAAKPFTGYKLHAAAATEAPLLTSICVSPGNEHDGQHAGTLIDQEPEDRRPQRVIGDTAYGNVETREELEARSVEVLAPADTTSPKDGVIPKDAFAIDLEASTVTCPGARRRECNGPTLAASGSRASSARRAHLARSDSGARPAVSGRSASAAARTSARRRSAAYPIPMSASTSTASDSGSSASSG